MSNRNTLLIALLVVQIVSFGQEIKEVARIGISSTVSIVSLDKISQPLGFGSGFMVDNELVVTNVHVVEGASSVYILKNSEQKK